MTEGYTAIGEGLALAQQYFAFSREKEGQNRGQIIILFTDGVNNWGRDPLEQIERASRESTRIYYIGVALEPGSSQDIAAEVPLTGGQFFDVRDPKHLVEAVDAIDKIEKGRFHTLQLVQQQPAYFIFVLLAFAALALRDGAERHSSPSRPQLTAPRPRRLVRRPARASTGIHRYRRGLRMEKTRLTTLSKMS